MRPTQSSRLRYVNDMEAGLTRRKRGKGFSYHFSDGSTLTDKTNLERIKALAIPPRWTSVWICPDADGHIQATGRDGAGRKQYRYHTVWTEERSAAKYSQLLAFGRAIPSLRARVSRDLGLRGRVEDRVLATVVWLLDNTMIRVGNDSYADTNGSFGLTTLRDQHVEITGQSLVFQFNGKSGRVWNLRLSDRRIARTVRSIQPLPGQRLFQYLDAAGKCRQVGSHDVNSYIHDAIGDGYSSKDFRTWGGTVRALALPVCDQGSGYKIHGVHAEFQRSFYGR